MIFKIKGLFKISFRFKSQGKMLGFLALSLLTVVFANEGIVSSKKGLILPLAVNFDMFSLYLSFPARNSKFHLQCTRIIVVCRGRKLSIRKCSFSPNLNKDEKRSILNTLTKSLVSLFLSQRKRQFANIST